MVSEQAHILSSGCVKYLKSLDISCSMLNSPEFLYKQAKVTLDSLYTGYFDKPCILTLTDHTNKEDMSTLHYFRALHFRSKFFYIKLITLRYLNGDLVSC